MYSVNSQEWLCLGSGVVKRVLKSKPAGCSLGVRVGVGAGKEVQREALSAHQPLDKFRVSSHCSVCAF